MTDEVELAPFPDSTPRHLAPGDVGLVTPRDFVHPQPFTFKSGQVIPGFTLRYETYGALNATRDNAILICHALSGDHHCAGWHSPTDRKPDQIVPPTGFSIRGRVPAGAVVIAAQCVTNEDGVVARGVERPVGFVAQREAGEFLSVFKSKRPRMNEVPGHDETD